MAPFRVRLVTGSPAPVIALEGYVAKDAGQALQNLVEEALNMSPKGIVIDFSASEVISSPGVAVLLDVVLHVVDDGQIPCILVGLNQSQANLMEMTGVLPIADMAPSREAALALLT